MFDLESLPQKSESAQNKKSFSQKIFHFWHNNWEYPKAEENSFVYCWWLSIVTSCILWILHSITINMLPFTKRIAKLGKDQEVKSQTDTILAINDSLLHGSIDLLFCNLIWQNWPTEAQMLVITFLKCMNAWPMWLLLVSVVTRLKIHLSSNILASLKCFGHILTAFCSLVRTIAAFLSSYLMWSNVWCEKLFDEAQTFLIEWTINLVCTILFIS